jgi:hypothetical protein
MGRLGSDSSGRPAQYSGTLKCKKCGNAISMNKGTRIPPCRCGGTSWEYQTITKR